MCRDSFWLVFLTILQVFFCMSFNFFFRIKLIFFSSKKKGVNQNRALFKCVMKLATPRCSPDNNDQSSERGTNEEIRKASMQLKLNDLVRRISLRTMILRWILAFNFHFAIADHNLFIFYFQDTKGDCLFVFFCDFYFVRIGTKWLLHYTFNYKRIEGNLQGSSDQVVISL